MFYHLMDDASLTHSLSLPLSLFIPPSLPLSIPPPPLPSPSVFSPPVSRSPSVHPSLFLFLLPLLHPLSPPLPQAGHSRGGAPLHGKVRHGSRELPVSLLQGVPGAAGGERTAQVGEKMVEQWAREGVGGDSMCTRVCVCFCVCVWVYACLCVCMYVLR